MSSKRQLLKTAKTEILWWSTSRRQHQLPRHVLVLVTTMLPVLLLPSVIRQFTSTPTFL